MPKIEDTAAQEDLEAMSDRFGDFFANEGNPAGSDPENPKEDDPVDDGTDGIDEPFLEDDPDYDPDELYDPDKEPKAEEKEEPKETLKEEPKEEPEEEVKEEEEVPEEEEEVEEEPDKEEELKQEEPSDLDSFKDELMKEIEANAVDPAAGKKWAELRFKERAAQAKLRELESEGINTPEMKEISAKAERVSEVEVKLKEAQDKLALYDFQTTPEYRKEIQEPYNDISLVSKDIEATASIPEGAIMKAISVGDKATQNANIENLANNYDISARDLNTIFNQADNMLKLSAKDADLRSTAQERLNESRAEQEAREAYISEQEKSVYRDSVNKTFSQYEGQISAFLNSDGTNNDEWSNAIKDSEALDFKGDPEIQGLGAFALTAVPHLMKQNNEYAAEIAKLKALQNRTKSVKPPKVSNTSGSGKKSSGSSSSKPMSLSDAIGARLASGE